MEYQEFERILSPERMSRYLYASKNDTRRAMQLYRYNLKLSQELFTIISCFEVALRNRIDIEFTKHYGQNWLRDFILPGGCLAGDDRVRKTRRLIETAYFALIHAGCYSPSQLLAAMEFGVWKYMFSSVQYRLTGRVLLNIFTNKPKSSKTAQYNHTAVFNDLDAINSLRNRIAHHEPICFAEPLHTDTRCVRRAYDSIMRMLEWMGINGPAFVYGLDHIIQLCEKVEALGSK